MHIYLYKSLTSWLSAELPLLGCMQLLLPTLHSVGSRLRQRLLMPLPVSTAHSLDAFEPPELSVDSMVKCYTLRTRKETKAEIVKQIRNMYKNIKLTKTHTHKIHKHRCWRKTSSWFSRVFLLRLVSFLLTNFICTEICSLLLSPKMLTTHRRTHKHWHSRAYMYFCIYSHAHTQAKIYMYCVLNNQLNCDGLLLLLCSGIFYARCFTLACEINAWFSPL